MFTGLLPIGSVVLLKDSTKRVMIIGYCQTEAKTATKTRYGITRDVYIRRAILTLMKYTCLMASKLIKHSPLDIRMKSSLSLKRGQTRFTGN